MVNIGKVIYNRCKDIVNNRCFPIVAENTTNMPFIVYQRESTSNGKTKDGGLYEESHNIQISIVTEKYDEGIALAQEVFNKFEDFEGKLEGIEITDTKITSISEAYNGAYIQYINLTIKTQ